MNLFKKFKKPLALCLGVGVLWTIQFLLLPIALPRFFPQSNEATLLLILPLIFISTAGTWRFRIRVTQWLPADGLYALLTALAHHHGQYGIGLRGVRLDGTSPTYSPGLAALTAACILAGLVLTQAAAWGMGTRCRRKKKTP